MNTLSNDESLPQTIEELEAEIEIILQMITETKQKIKDLASAESFEDGIFYAQEIHEQRQNKLILQTRKEFRAVHIRRLLYQKSQGNI